MSGARPFRDVKLQWLQQLSWDKDLSDSARSVALYIITTHLNGHTALRHANAESAWPPHGMRLAFVPSPLSIRLVLGFRYKAYGKSEQPPYSFQRF